MSLTSWGSRTATEPNSRTESRAAGDGPTDELRTENGKALSSRDTSHDNKIASWRKTYKQPI